MKAIFCRKQSIALLFPLLCCQLIKAQCFSSSLLKPPNQAVCNGASTTDVHFTSNMPGAFYQWKNNNPGIGLAASGMGDINAFVANNSDTLPAIANISVIPGVVANGTGLAYIANYGAGTVSVVDPATMQAVTSIAVGNNPYGVTVSNDGAKVFVANRGSGTVSVINTATYTVMATVPVGNLPQSISANRTGTRAYVSIEGDHKVAVLDAIADTVITHIATGNLPNGIAINTSGNRVFVANLGDNSITVINGLTNTVITTVNVGTAPQSLCVDPDSKMLYVANGGSNNVSVLSVANNTVIDSFPVEQNPKGICIDPTGHWLYVSNYAAASVTVIDVFADTVLQHIAVGTNPHGLAASSDGKYVLVANRGAGTVSVIETSSQSVVGNIPVGAAPVSTGNFIAVGDTCVGVSRNFQILVHPTSGVVPTVQLSANATIIKPAQSVLFTASATNAGTQPIYQFYINNKIARSGFYNTFSTDHLQHGDKVSCTMTSSIPCATTALATSDTVIISTQVPADYVFFPMDEDGLYSNMANWLNGNYPGNMVAENKTISFRANGKFKKAVMDVNTTILGEWYIEDSVDLWIPSGKKIVIGQQGGWPPNFGRVFSGSFSSQLTVDGALQGYGLRAELGSKVIINGIAGFNPGDPSDQFVSSLYFDSLLQVNGQFYVQVGYINAKRVQVQATGRLTMSYGYDFNLNQLHVDRLINDGYMFLNEGTLYVSVFENNGSFTADFLNTGSLLQNTGSFTIHCKTPLGAYAVSQSGLLMNSGTMSFTSDGGLTCIFGGQVVNEGTMDFYTKNDPALPDMAVFSNAFINRKTFSTQHGTVRFTGTGINAASLNINGRIVVEGSSFINEAICNWFVESTTMANELKGSFLNSGTIKNEGLLYVTDKFLNAGVLDVIPH